MTAFETDAQRLGRDFARHLYRGTSAFADSMDVTLLRALHVPTRLDDQILLHLEAGRSVILTGNPGDGKTHIQRVLRDQLQQVQPAVEVLFDASACSNSEVMEQWQRAHQNQVPFFAAINQAVLFDLRQLDADFAPLQSAISQVENAVFFGDEPDFGSHSTVVFDLNWRNALEREIVSAIWEKLQSPPFAARCESCPSDGCDFARALKNWNEPARERLQLLFDRVAQRGTHASVRAVQGLVSFLLSGDRNCAELLSNSSNIEYEAGSLVWDKGQGALFNALRMFDPKNQTHPLWEERLIEGQTQPADWFSQVGDMTLALAQRRAKVA